MFSSMFHKTPTVKRIDSWKGRRGSVFYGDSSLPAPLLEECHTIFLKYSQSTAPEDQGNNSKSNPPPKKGPKKGPKSHIQSPKKERRQSITSKCKFLIIQKNKLPNAFDELGLLLTDEELEKLHKTILDDVNPKGVDLSEFCRLVRSIRQNFLLNKNSEKHVREQNIIEAWCHLGGNKDKSGKISASKMKALLAKFVLTFDVEKQLNQLDVDNSGDVDYWEFKKLFKAV